VVAHICGTDIGSKASEGKAGTGKGVYSRGMDKGRTSAWPVPSCMHTREERII